MSDLLQAGVSPDLAVPALGAAARFQGPAATVSAQPLRGMITLRADLAAPETAEAMAALGLSIPAMRKVVASDSGEAAALWMSPDELMILTPYGQADAACAEIAKAMAGAHHLALNVSDARAMFAIEGAGARAVLAKGAPADLSAAAFGPGDLRRTRVGLLAAAFWMTGPERFELICFRSYAAHMWGWLQAAAAAPGPDAVL